MAQPGTIEAVQPANQTASILNSAMEIGHSAVSYLTDRLTFSGKLSRELAVGLATVGGIELATSEAALAHPAKPAGMIIPVNSYYGSMLGQSGYSPYRVQQVAISAHQLVRSGACVYNTSGIPIAPVERTVDTPKGESDTYCPPRFGGHSAHVFFSRDKLISNPSMDFQPLLQKLGSQAAQSVGLTAASHGLPSRIHISLGSNGQSEADVFYARNIASTSTKQLKELTFRTSKHGGTVHKVWY